MIKLLSSIFSFFQLLFCWLPPYLSTFFSLLCEALIVFFVVIIAVKVIAIGIDLLGG